MSCIYESQICHGDLVSEIRYNANLKNKDNQVGPFINPYINHFSGTSALSCKKRLN